MGCSHTMGYNKRNSPQIVRKYSVNSPWRERSNLTCQQNASRKKKLWCRLQCRFATRPQPPGVLAVRRPNPPRFLKPPLLPPNRLLTWHTPIGKLAATRVVRPRKTGCAPNRNCAPSPLPSNLCVTICTCAVPPADGPESARPEQALQSVSAWSWPAVAAPCRLLRGRTASA